ncbi:hypothetical protein HGRIS_004412 [Hohenbuehelia grisea]|uniref:Uncharacterized protein n=1 Tax=Hohenbuehelia grisea TaxID=104357 RepID=A0ABR3JBW1_9AGAR
MQYSVDPKAPVVLAGPSSEALPPVFRTAFACLSLNSYDRLRLIRFSQHDIGVVRAAVQQAWPRGIQDERNYYGSHEFKLRGYPWSGQADEAVPSRQLILTVLSDLYDAGWVLTASTDISKKKLDKDALLFRFQSPPPPPCTWFAISFNKGDRLRLIGAPNQVTAQFKDMLGPLLQSDGWREEGAYEFKCKGYPWMAHGSEAVSTRILLLRMLEILEHNNYSLYASIDQNTGPAGKSKRSGSETDTWYCCRPT